MLEHKAQVRARKIAWDVREVVQHGLNADTVVLDLDAEWRECDRIQAVLAGAGEPVRILVEGGGFNIPSSLMERTGAIRMCLIGYVGETARIVTAKEAKPLTVVESGEMGGTDPAPEQPDLWATLMKEVRKATEGAKTAAQSATRAEADLRAAAERGDFDGEDGKTPVRGVDYWTAEDRKPIEDATLDATTAAGMADAAAEKASVGEASRAASEVERVANEAERVEAESGRKSEEATRAANESKRAETFDANLTSWNSKVDAACEKATDTASKAAQDAKTATDAAIAKTEEATNAAIAKADKATASATTAANKAETVVAQLPIPSGNVLKGEAEATLAHVDDAYPAPLVTTKVLGQSNQQQEPAPSPENPQEITNLAKAELVITGKNLINADGAKKSGWNVLLPNTKLMNGATYVFTAPKCKRTCSIYATASDTRLVGFISSGKTERFTVPSNADFSKGCFLAGSSADSLEDMDTVINTVMVEVGTVASGYSAPKKYALTTIDLKGNELCSLPNGVKDEVVIDAEGNVSLIKRLWKLSRRIGDMNNNETYPGWKCANAELIDAVGSGVDIQPRGMSTHFQRFSINTRGVTERGGILYVSGYKQSELIAKHPDEVVTFIGERKEPQTIPLGKVELPALPEATSNVWNNGNIPANVYINYLKDVNIAFADLESKLTQAVVAAAANL